MSWCFTHCHYGNLGRRVSKGEGRDTNLAKPFAKNQHTKSKLLFVCLFVCLSVLELKYKCYYCLIAAVVFAEVSICHNPWPSDWLLGASRNAFNCKFDLLHNPALALCHERHCDIGLLNSFCCVRSSHVQLQ